VEVFPEGALGPSNDGYPTYFQLVERLKNERAGLAEFRKPGREEDADDGNLAL